MTLNYNLYPGNMKVSDMTQRHFRAFDGKSYLENYKVLLRIPAIRKLTDMRRGTFCIAIMIMITIPCDTNACGYETEKLPRLHWHGKFKRQGGNREKEA